MPRTIRCPQCQQRYSVADEAAGKKLRCPKCQSLIDIPPPAEPMIVPALVVEEPQAAPAPGGYWPGIDAPRTASQPTAQPSAAGYGMQTGQVLQGQIVQGQVVQGPIVQGQVLSGSPPDSAGYGVATGQAAPQPMTGQPAAGQPTAAPLDWLSSFDPGYQGAPGGGYGTASQGGSQGPLGAPAIRPWKRKRNVPWGKIVAVAAFGGAAVFGIIFVVSLISGMQGGGGGGADTGPLNPAAVPLPSFPDRPAAASIPGGGSKAVVRLPVAAGRPGFAATLYIYLPPGNHAPKSLPCVFYAPAGSTLLTGMNLGEGDSAEHLPWVQAGFAVVAYEQDGDVPDRNGMVLHADFRRGYQQFAASHAGLVNARNAMEYTLAKVPEVAPDRLYTAGHSSAGTAALLLAAFEPRIRGCAAFAPATDPSTRPESSQMINSMLGGDRSAIEFLRRSSPALNAAKIRCPVYLFHSPGDTVVPYAGTNQFKSTLESQGTKVTFQTGMNFDHYQSMIQEGLPQAIRWMKNLDKPGSGDALPAGPIAKTPATPPPPFGQTTPPTAPGVTGTGMPGMPPGVPGMPGGPAIPGVPGASGMPPSMPYPGGFPAGGPPPAPGTMPTNPGVPPNPFSPAKPTTPPNMGAPFGSGFGTTPGTVPTQPGAAKTKPKTKPPKPSKPSTPPPSNGFDLE